MRKALAGARIFDGTRFLDPLAIILEDGKIAALLPAKDLPADLPVEWLPGGTLAPGFLDAQVNGGAGRMFNAAPTSETIGIMVSAHRRFGTTGMLPTLITDRVPVLAAAITAAEEAQASIPGCLGLHLEGPHLAPVRKGAHLAALMRPMSEADAEHLLSIRCGVLMLTVAAEQVTPALVRRLSDGGVIVSLGHSDAPYDQVMALVDAGARGVTHLYNAMSQLAPREPGLLGAALESGALWCGIIADGHHVHAAALRLALRAKMGPGRLFLVSDAMATVGFEGNEITLNDRIIRRSKGRLTLEDGTLAGSDLDMASAVRFCVRALGLGVDEALRMASLYPAQYLGLDSARGSIRPGMRADLVHLDAGLAVTRSWIAGEAA